MSNGKPHAISVGSLDRMVINIAEGNMASLSSLYSQLQKPIFVLALSLLHDYYAAEDVMQETFVKVMAHAKEYRKGTNAKAWIFSIARNLCLDSLKRMQSGPLSENITDSDDLEDKVASAVDIIRILDTLDETEKQIIVMHFYGGLRKVQIAKLMNVPAGSIRMKYSRALKKLKDNPAIF